MGQEKLEEDIHEAEKPLARYIDDQDLDKLLREKEREDDPMLQYLRKENQKEGDSDKKQYKGPAPAPNRYGIKPGYRWDGVTASRRNTLKVQRKKNRSITNDINGLLKTGEANVKCLISFFTLKEEKLSKYLQLISFL